MELSIEQSQHNRSRGAAAAFRANCGAAEAMGGVSSVNKVRVAEGLRA